VVTGSIVSAERAEGQAHWQNSRRDARERPTMSKRNPAREIAISLVLAVVLGIGFYVYIVSSITPPTGPALVPPSLRAAEQDTRPDDARRVAASFVQHLAAGRPDDAYLMMANAYRQTTPLAAFRTSCTSSPFLSTAASVSLSRIHEERAAGQQGRGSLNGSGVLITRSGTVDVTFFFVDDPGGVAIINVNIAGAPALPMGNVAPSPSPGASGVGTRR
jgi:hypothetical protein